MTEHPPAALDGFDLTDLDLFTNGFPHHVFTRLRAQAPILFHPPGKTVDGEGFWVLSRHDDVLAAAEDPAFSSQGGGGRAGGGTHIDDLAAGVHAGTMINTMDDPRHRCLRDQVSPATDPAALEIDLRVIAENLVAEAVAKGEGDLTAAIAAPMALRTSLRLLGIDRRDWPPLEAWADVSVGFEDRHSGGDSERSQNARMALYMYSTGLLAARKAAPGKDLLSLAARAELPAGQRQMSDYEREIFLNLVMAMGSEPPRAAIAHGLLALAGHPEQWHELRADNSLIPGAIEEMLRWSSPTPYNRRTATRDIELRGASIKAGDKVTFWWASANRDEQVFADPFRFDIRRSPNPHLAFGAGTHSCLAADLGRLELRLVLEALLDRVEELRPGTVAWGRHNKHTVIDAMPVTYAGAVSKPAPALPEEPPSQLPSEPGLYVLMQVFPFNPFDPAIQADPYPIYRRLAEKGPVFRTPGGTLAVTGHEEISEALRNPDLGWGDRQDIAVHFDRDADGKPVRPFLFMDPPDHTRIRSLVSTAFASRAVEHLRPRAQQLMAELIDRAGSSFDLLEAVARPLTATLAGELMGVPTGYSKQFQSWSDAIFRALDPDFLLTAEQVARRRWGRDQFNNYFAELIAQRREKPGTDLVSALIAAEQEGDRLSEAELVTTCTAIIAAGYGLTVHLIGNGMLALLRHPDQLEWLRRNPDRVDDAVSELLRYDPPTQLLSRVALKDTTVGGAPVNAGGLVMFLVGAAGRDPRAYDQPDVLDLARKPTVRPLGFGLGIHYCVGAPLARLSAGVALSAMAQQDLAMAAPGPEYGMGVVMRGLVGLGIRR
jgi:cytochrome P450